MPGAADFARYRAEPGEPFSLADQPTADTDGYEAGEAHAEPGRHVERIADLQARLYAEEQRSVLVVLQGIDAAGKDSTVAHVFRGANPRGCRVYGFKEPTPEESGHDFLWRYHQHTPARGMIHVFNRSHYEDVLVVRVKGLVEEDRWRSRYDSINDFERMLVREGTADSSSSCTSRATRSSSASRSACDGRTSTTSSPPTTCASGATGTPTRRPTGTPCASRARRGRRGTRSRRTTSGSATSRWAARCPARWRRWTRGGPSPRRNLEAFAAEELDQLSSR